MADIENGDMSLDQRLDMMGLNPKEFKAYGNAISRTCDDDMY